MIPGKSGQVPVGSIYLSSEWSSDRNARAQRPLGNSAPFMQQQSLNSFGGMMLDQYDNSMPLRNGQMPLQNSSPQMFSVPRVSMWSQPGSTAFRKESVSDDVSVLSSSTLLDGTNDTVDTDLLTQNVLRELRNSANSGDDDDDDDNSANSGASDPSSSLLPVMSNGASQDSSSFQYGSQDRQERYISILEDLIRSMQECVRDATANDHQGVVSQLYQRIVSIVSSCPDTMHLALSIPSPGKYSPLDMFLAPQTEKMGSLSLGVPLSNSRGSDGQNSLSSSASSLVGSSTSPPVISIFNSSSQPVASASPGKPTQPVIMPPPSFMQPASSSSRSGERSPTSTSGTFAMPSSGNVNPLLFATNPITPATVDSNRTRFVASAPVFIPRGDSPAAQSPKRKMAGPQQRSPSPQTMGISLEDIHEPEDVKGHVVQMTQYQAGCRYLQKQLDALEGLRKQQFVQIVFNEVVVVLPQVITDTYGQYLIPKLMEHSNDAQRREMIMKLAPEMKHIACHSFGSHGLQRSLQFLKDDQVQLLGAALNQHVSALCKDQKGNYLIQCFVKIFGPGPRVEFIFQLLTNELVDIAKHKVGCTVICRCLENADDQQTRAIVNKVLANALPFARDEYANYVVQHIILHCAKQYSSSLINAFRGHAKELCQQKFGSNVMEKCLETSDHEQFNSFLAELTTDEFLPTILSDQYGNFVLQKILDLCSKEQHSSLVSRILPILHSGHSPFAVHIEKKLMKK